MSSDRIQRQTRSMTRIENEFNDNDDCVKHSSEMQCKCQVSCRNVDEFDCTSIDMVKQIPLNPSSPMACNELWNRVSNGTILPARKNDRVLSAEIDPVKTNQHSVSKEK
jgi:hypothetical protein